MSTDVGPQNTAAAVIPSGGHTFSGAADPSGLVINATYDASVSAEAQTAFNSLIKLYENTFSNPVQVNLNITFGDTALGASSTAEVIVPYSVWVDHLKDNATSNPGNTFEGTAVSSLPTTDPLGNGNVTLTTADAKALGIGVGNVASDGTITFSSHSDVTFEYNQVATAGSFDFMNVAAHELNEVLGIGSALTGLANSATVPTGDFSAEDYFRYQTGSTSRDVTLDPNAHVSFSCDGGKTDVAQFNQDNNIGDRNDWINGNGSTPPSDPLVQDARAFPGQVAPILTTSAGQTPESTVLSTLGYDEIPCYYQGSLIDTPLGRIPIEELSVGDHVQTADGHSAAVTWIGYRRVSTLFADPLRTYPIRIKANALADDVPSRDLLLSPDHAILIDNILVQAGALVNGISIRQEINVPQVFTYYHIELDDHRLVLVENTPAETFISNIDRAAFDNWADYEVRYPDGKSATEMQYPRAKSYRQVPQHVRSRLAARGVALFGGDAEKAA